MFERFSDQARRVVVLAQEEARKLNHHHIGTEHILLGILRESECTAAEALRGMDIATDALVAEIKARTGTGDKAPAGHIPFTPQAKQVLEFSLRESQHLSSDYIGSEHILLGLVREGQGIGAQVLAARGVTLERMREEMTRRLGAVGGDSRIGHPSMLVSTSDTLQEMAVQLRAISRRLGVIEAKLGIEESPAAARLRTAGITLTRVRRQKESAIDRQDFKRAAELRDEERRLLVSRSEAEAEMLAEDTELPEETGQEDTPGGEAAMSL